MELKDITPETKIESTTFVNYRSVSYTTNVGELLNEINHYQAFWLSSVGGEYTNSVPTSVRNPKVVIKTKGLTPEIRIWLSSRMK